MLVIDVHIIVQYSIQLASVVAPCTKYDDKRASGDNYISSSYYDRELKPPFNLMTPAGSLQELICASGFFILAAEQYCTFA